MTVSPPIRLEAADLSARLPGLIVAARNVAQTVRTASTAAARPARARPSGNSVRSSRASRRPGSTGAARRARGARVRPRARMGIGAHGVDLVRPVAVDAVRLEPRAGRQGRSRRGDRARLRRSVRRKRRARRASRPHAADGDARGDREPLPRRSRPTSAGRVPRTRRCRPPRPPAPVRSFFWSAIFSASRPRPSRRFARSPRTARSASWSSSSIRSRRPIRSPAMSSSSPGGIDAASDAEGAKSARRLPRAARRPSRRLAGDLLAPRLGLQPAPHRRLRRRRRCWRSGCVFLRRRSARTGAPEPMFGLPLAFAAPAVLVALAGLGALYYLLRVTPPRAAPRGVSAAPAAHRAHGEGERARANAVADPAPASGGRRADHRGDGPARCGANLAAPEGSGPLLVVFDDGWPAAGTFEKRVGYAREQMLRRGPRRPSGRASSPFSQGGRDIVPLNAGEIEGQARSLAPAPLRSVARDGRGGRSSGILRPRPTRTCCGSPTGSNSAAHTTSPRRISGLARPDVVADGARLARVAGARQRGRIAEGASRPLRHGRAAVGVARALDAQGREHRARAVRLRRNRDRRGPLRAAGRVAQRIPRLAIDGDRSAGAVWLVDERARRRRVAIVVRRAAPTLAQPLLAPTYYITARARAVRRRARMAQPGAADPIVRCSPRSPRRSCSPT